MTDNAEKFPRVVPDGPHAFIQWKGTDACMDLYCACGWHFHLDADFAYHVKCGECGQVYACNPYVMLLPISTEPSGTYLLRADE
jgi:hypothetical protein